MSNFRKDGIITFTLMCQNHEILDFDYDVKNKIMINFRSLNNEKYAPYNLIKNGLVNEERFKCWWNNRQIPDSRYGLKEFF